MNKQWLLLVVLVIFSGISAVADPMFHENEESIPHNLKESLKSLIEGIGFMGIGGVPLLLLADGKLEHWSEDDRLRIKGYGGLTMLVGFGLIELSLFEFWEQRPSLKKLLYHKVFSL